MAETAAPPFRTHPARSGTPAPLPSPALDELRPELVLGAPADPLRLTIVQKLPLEAEEYDHSCGWFGIDRPKSSPTHRFKVLREAGVTRQGPVRPGAPQKVRMEDLERRFPGCSR